MTPYCVQCGDIKGSHLRVLDDVREFIREHTAVFNLDGADCHRVCELVAEAFPTKLRHVRGRFAGGWEHSWLAFLDDDLTVIDAYPWACASGPMLVTLKWMSPWFGLYREVPDPPLPHPRTDK